VPSIDSSARVKILRDRVPPTPFEIFNTVFGEWIQKHILPAISAHIEEERQKRAKKQQRRWKEVDMPELLAFFLNQFLLGIVLHPEKQQKDGEKISAARAGLVGQTRLKVLCAALNFQDDVLRDIMDGITSCVQQLVELGPVLTVDEAVWAYYARDAKYLGKLRHLPNKPHKDGMLTYLLCQRLRFSNRPFALAFAPTFLGPSPTPRDALMYL
jgi:hypothetical protein